MKQATYCGLFLRYSELPLAEVDYSNQLPAFPHAFISFEIALFYPSKESSETYFIL